jgi:hypothetical protein
METRGRGTRDRDRNKERDLEQNKAVKTGRVVREQVEKSFSYYRKVKLNAEGVSIYRQYGN